MTGQPFNHSHLVSDVTPGKCEILFKAKSNHTYCFFGMFMTYVLETGYGMNASSKLWALEFKKEVCITVCITVESPIKDPLR